MAKIRYTHVFNLLHNTAISTILIIGGIKLTNIALLFLKPLWISISNGFQGNTTSVIEAILYILLWIFCVVLIYNAIALPLKPLSTLLYLRFYLFVPATWEDARKTMELFEGDENGNWYPLTALRQVPRHFRREVLLEFFNQILHESGRIPKTKPEFQWEPNFSNDSDQSTHSSSEDIQVVKARQVLGVNADSSIVEIKNAYRHLIKKYHPDIYSQSQPEVQVFANKKAVELNEAYSILIKTKNESTN